MEKKHYIFVTDEGYTEQPIREGEEQAEMVENLQVLGFGEGVNEQEAFTNLLEAYPYLKETSFSECFCYELKARRQSAVFTIEMEE